MSHRPLAIVSGLTIGDYLLWNWSLNGSHDVLALVSGLTLPPLAAAFVWLIALTGARLLARGTRRSAKGAGATPGRAGREGAPAAATSGAPARFRFGTRRRIAKRYAQLNELRATNRARAARTAQTAPTATAPRQTPAPPSTSATATAQSSPSPRTRSSRKIAA